MKINYLKINGFGKLNNKEIKFGDNINLIYGENEAGKTTLLKFIAGMFYGISKNKNKKEFSDFERYNPWNAEEFSGKMEYTLDNNEKLQIYRDFTKKNPQIYNKYGEDISKNFNIDKTKGNEFFYEQTNIDEAMFFSTTLIEQKGVVLDNSDQAVLTQKIANILSTGEENISYKKTMDKLNKKAVEEVGSERTVGRPLNIICNKLNILNEENKKIQENTEIQKELENKKINIKSKINEKDIKINLIKEIKKIKEKINLEKEKIKINDNLISEENKKINEIKNNINENKGIIKEKSKINTFILAILILLNIILFVLKINKIINIILFIGTVLFTIFILVKIINNKNKVKERNKIEKKYLNEIKQIKSSIEKIEENKKQINNKILENEEKEKSEIIKKYIEKIASEEIQYLFTINIDEINNEIDILEKDLSSLKLQAYTNDVDYNNAIRKIEEKAKIQEEISNLTEEKEEILKLDKSINIAKEALERAYKKMKEEITPKFTKNLSEIIEKISNSKYNKAKYVDEEGLVVELQSGECINANKLSIGTIDQLYLSLRLSAMKEITEEKMPIILDETFAYYDDNRLKNILTYINEEFKDNQVIIFTCSNREKEILEKNDIKYELINLHK